MCFQKVRKFSAIPSAKKWTHKPKRKLLFHLRIKDIFRDYSPLKVEKQKNLTPFWKKEVNRSNTVPILYVHIAKFNKEENFPIFIQVFYGKSLILSHLFQKTTNKFQSWSEGQRTLTALGLENLRRHCPHCILCTLHC